MLTTIVLLALLSNVENVLANAECSPPLEIEKNCAKAECLSAVTGTVIPWHDITPVSFLARWKPEPNAMCYFVELLNGYTINVLENITCFPDTAYEFTNLTPNKIYGFQVKAISFDCKMGPSGDPARTRTYWAPTTTTTVKPFITRRPKPGTCGKKFFTCQSDKTCVKIEKWCDRVFDCPDDSDERGCPGGCQEIDIEFKNGNYSCTRWGSPYSGCLFDCDEPYTRVGSRLTLCRKKKWHNPIPTCKLHSTTLLKVVKGSATGTTITVQWKPVEGAAGYVLQADEQVGSKAIKVRQKRTHLVDAVNCCQAVIPDLKPKTEFKVTLRAVDTDGDGGIKSTPLFARTTAKEDSEFVDESESDGGSP